MLDGVDRHRGFRSYDWQLNVAEALHYNLDAFLIAGTGYGKTMPFALLSYLNPNKLVVVVSPLKALEADMASRVQDWGIKAVAINEDTYSTAMHKTLVAARPQMIFVSPEFLLTKNRFSALVTSTEYASSIKAFIVDEGHLISRWGDGFRQSYAQLRQLHAFGNSNQIGFLVASATLPPHIRRDVMTSLDMVETTTFEVNLGNNRPNLTLNVVNVASSSGTPPELLPILLPQVFTPDTKLRSAIVYCKTVDECHELCLLLRGLVPPELQRRIDFYHSRRSSHTKDYKFKLFMGSCIDIVFTTDALGLGCDKQNVETTVCFKVPDSLEDLLQKLGRGGRGTNLQATGWLLVEPSVHKKISSARKSKDQMLEDELDDIPLDLLESVGAVNDDESDDETADPSQAPGTAGGASCSSASNPGTPARYAKEIHPEFRRYIEAKNCRREVLDAYFVNPKRSAPSSPCCDNCTKVAAQRNPPSQTESERPVTGGAGQLHVTSQAAQPTDDASGSPRDDSDNAPDESDSNRDTQTGSARPKNRTREHLVEAKEILAALRMEIWERDCLHSDLMAFHILSNKQLQHFASKCAQYTTVHDLLQSSCRWQFAEVYGAEMLGRLRDLDDRRAANLAAANAARKAETARLRAEKALVSQIQSAIRKSEKAQERAVQKELKKAEKQQQRAAAKQQQVAQEAIERRRLQEARPWLAPPLKDSLGRGFSGPFRKIAPAPTHPTDRTEQRYAIPSNPQITQAPIEDTNLKLVGKKKRTQRR